MLSEVVVHFTAIQHTVIKFVLFPFHSILNNHMSNLHKDLFDDNLIDEKQYQFLDAINKRKVVSLYYELRLLLYLGILLFTGGIGYIVYQNLSSVGHIALMFLLTVCIGIGGYYIHLKSKPYKSSQVNVEHFYFDYVVVLISLLIISLFTYIQVYFDLVELLVKWTSIVTSALFMFIAYRYDNKMILSMGITAFAAAIGLTVTPVNWITGEWLSGVNIYVLSISLGIFLLVIGQMLNQKNIKKHFTFTYHNFGILLTYFGTLALIFDSNQEVLFAFVLLVFSGLVGWYSWKQKTFLFFLYSCICIYISFTYLFFSMGVGEVLWIWYFPISCILAVVLLVKHKAHFSND